MAMCDKMLNILITIVATIIQLGLTFGRLASTILIKTIAAISIIISDMTSEIIIRISIILHPYYASKYNLEMHS